MADLKLNIVADNTGALSILDDTGKKIANVGSDVERASNSFLKMDVTAVKVAATMKVIDLGFTAVSGSINAVLSAISSVTNQFGKIDGIAKMSQEIGVAVEELSAFELAATLSGTNAEIMGRAMRNLARNMTQVVQETGEAAPAFKALDIEVTKVGGGLKEPIALMKEIADKFQGATDNAEKVAIAMKAVGEEAGPKLIPFLNQGSEGIQRLIDLNAALGLQVTQTEAKLAESIQDNIAIIGFAVEGAQRQLAMGLAPAIDSITSALVAFISATGEGEGSMRELGAAIGEELVSAFIMALDALDAFLVNVQNSGFNQALYDVLVGGFEKIGDVLLPLGVQMGAKLVAGLNQVVAEGMAKLFDLIGQYDPTGLTLDIGARFREGAEVIVDYVNNNMGPSFQDLGGVSDETKARIESFRKGIDAAKTALTTLKSEGVDAVKTSLPPMVKETSIAVRVVGDAGEAAEKTVTEIQQLNDALKSLSDSTTLSNDEMRAQIAIYEEAQRQGLDLAETERRLAIATIEVEAAARIAAGASEQLVNEWKAAQIESIGLAEELTAVKDSFKDIDSETEKTTANTKQLTSATSGLGGLLDAFKRLTGVTNKQTDSFVALGLSFGEDVLQKWASDTEEFESVFLSMVERLAESILGLGELGSSIFGDVSGDAATGMAAESISLSDKFGGWVKDLFGADETGRGAFFGLFDAPVKPTEGFVGPLTASGNVSDGGAFSGFGGLFSGEMSPAAGALVGIGTGTTVSSALGSPTETWKQPVKGFDLIGAAGVQGIIDTVYDIMGAVLGAAGGALGASIGGPGGAALGGAVGGLVNKLFGELMVKDPTLDNLESGNMGNTFGMPEFGLLKLLTDLVFHIPTRGTMTRRALEPAFNESESFMPLRDRFNRDFSGDRVATFIRPGQGSPIGRGDRGLAAMGLDDATIQELRGQGEAVFAVLGEGFYTASSDTGANKRFFGDAALSGGLMYAEFFGQAVKEGQIDPSEVIGEGTQSIFAFATEMGVSIFEVAEALPRLQEGFVAIGRATEGMTFADAEESGLKAFGRAAAGMVSIFTEQYPAGTQVGLQALQSLTRDGTLLFDDMSNEQQDALIATISEFDNLQDVMTELRRGGFEFDLDELEEQINSAAMSAGLVGQTLGDALLNAGGDAQVAIDSIVNQMATAGLESIFGESINQLLDTTSIGLAFEDAFSLINNIGDVNFLDTDEASTFRAQMIEAIASGKANLEEYLPVLKEMVASAEELDAAMAEALAPTTAEAFFADLEKRTEAYQSSIKSSISGALSKGLEAGAAVMADGGSFAAGLSAGTEAFTSALSADLKNAVLQSILSAMTEAAVMQTTLAPLLTELEVRTAEAMADGVIDASERAELSALGNHIMQEGERAGKELEPVFEDLFTMQVDMDSVTDAEKHLMDVAAEANLAPADVAAFLSAFEGMSPEQIAAWTQANTAGVETVTLFGDMLDENLPKLEDTGASLDSLTGAFEDIFDPTEGLNNEFAGLVAASIDLGGASEKATGSLTDLAEAAGFLNATLAGSPGVPGAATGGVFASGLAVVGEAGPELVSALPRGGFRVTPISSRVASALMSGMGVPGLANGGCIGGPNCEACAAEGQRVRGMAGGGEEGPASFGDTPPPTSSAPCPPCWYRPSPGAACRFRTGCTIPEPTPAGPVSGDGGTEPEFADFTSDFISALQQAATAVGTVWGSSFAEEFKNAFEENAINQVIDAAIKGFAESPAMQKLNEDIDGIVAEAERLAASGGLSAEKAAEMADEIAEKAKEAAKAAEELEPFIKELRLAAIEIGFDEEGLKSIIANAAVNGMTSGEVESAIREMLYTSILDAFLEATFVNGPIGESIANWGKVFKAVMGKVLEDGIITEEELEQIRLVGEAALETIIPMAEAAIEAAEILARSPELFALNFEQSVKEAVKSAISQGLIEGASADDIANNVKLAIMNATIEGLIEAFLMQAAIMPAIVPFVEVIAETIGRVIAGEISAAAAAGIIQGAVEGLGEVINSPEFREAIELVGGVISDITDMFAIATPVIEQNTQSVNNLNKAIEKFDERIVYDLVDISEATAQIDPLGRTGRAGGSRVRTGIAIKDVPRAATGGHVVRDGLAVIHSGETIIPAHRQNGMSVGAMRQLVAEIANRPVIVKVGSKQIAEVTVNELERQARGGRRTFLKVG